MVAAPQKIVLASGNRKKVAELQHLLQPLGIAIIPQSQLHIPDADETGLTFIENAILKARHACRLSGLPAIADDSGLEVDALDGAPGIYSARFAGVPCNDANNNMLLLEKMKHLAPENRCARFQCVLVYLRHAEDPTPLICQGSWGGSILLTPQGAQGFGYDPLFFVPTHSCSTAEMLPEEKAAISHRGQAMRQLLMQLRQRYGQTL
jgi:XTP/dITP diphosphohydrolase